MNKIVCLVVILMAWSGLGCLRQDRLTAVCEVPGLKSTADARAITEAFKHPGPPKYLVGIYEVSPDIENQTVTLVYDNQTIGLINIHERIAEAGFAIGVRPAK